MSTSIKKKGNDSLIILASIGILLDTYIQGTDKYIHLVDTNFIFYVFGALVTIAALSGTVLTIILTTFPTKYYGYSIKEMLQFETFEMKFSKIISKTLIIVAFSTIGLAFNFINTMVLALFYVIQLVIFYSEYIWEISTNDNTCENIVKAELLRILNSGDNRKIIKSFNNLFDDYLFRIEQKSIDTSRNTMKLIESNFKKIASNDELLKNVELINFIDQKINDTFCYAASIIGYSSAIKEVLYICDEINKKKHLFYKEDYLFKSIEKIEFYNNEKFSESNIIKIYEIIDNLKSLDKEEKFYVLTRYFSCLLSNEIITKNYKNNLVERFLARLSDVSPNEDLDYELVRKRVILEIAKKHVFLNADDKIRTEIFTTLTIQLYGYGKWDYKKYFEIFHIYFTCYYFIHLMKK
jgi:hypothetical protein